MWLEVQAVNLNSEGLAQVLHELFGTAAIFIHSPSFSEEQLCHCPGDSCAAFSHSESVQSSRHKNT